MLHFRFRLVEGAGRARAEHSSSPPGGQEAERREEAKRRGRWERRCMHVERLLRMRGNAHVLMRAHGPQLVKLEVLQSVQEYVPAFSHTGPGTGT